jgi:predicted dehydrogenase
MQDKIGIGVIGAGYWGPNLIKNFMAIDGCQVLWVCDLKPGRRQYIQEQFPAVPVIGTIDRVLEDETVSAVVVATPVSTHHDLAMSALHAGKHIWIEKPLADSVSKADEIVQEAQSKGRVLFTDHLFVYNPAIQKAKEIIMQGSISDLCYAESGRVNLGPPASEIDVIWDLATHDLAITYYLWGKKPVEVVAYGRRFRHPTLLDMAFIHLHFDDESTTVHHVSWLCPEKIRRYFVAGKKGSLLFDDTQSEKKLRFIDQGVDSRIGAQDHENKALFYKPGEVRFPEYEQVEPLRAACEHFLYCIRNKQKPLADGVAGLAVLQMLEAAEFSIKHGSKPVKLDNRFVHSIV